MMMKTILLVLCLLVTILNASPLTKRPLIELQPATLSLTTSDELLQNVGDIWSDCTKSSDPASLVNVTISPDPPKKGQDLDVRVVVSLKEEVTGGKIEIDLKYGFIPIKQSLDLCSTVSNCPLAAGMQTLSISKDIPGAAPSGHYKGSVVVSDQSGKEIGCIDLDFHM